MFLDAIIVPFHYKEHLVKRSITHGKFYHKKEVFEEWGISLSSFVQKQLQNNLPENTSITSVPLHFFRKLTRGYNQSEILAKTLAKELGIPYSPLIKKRKHTRHQSHL